MQTALILPQRDREYTTTRETGGFGHAEFRHGLAEELPVDDGWADVIISNGVLNLCPDKLSTLLEFHRVMKPGGKLQIADIMVEKAVPEGAKRDIDLWTG